MVHWELPWWNLVYAGLSVRPHTQTRIYKHFHGKSQRTGKISRKAVKETKELCKFGVNLWFNLLASTWQVLKNSRTISGPCTKVGGRKTSLLLWAGEVP